MFKLKGYKTALVTGGAGFIGSHLVEELLKQGIKTIAVDNLIAGKLENIREFESDPNFKFVCSDISRFQDIEPYLKNVDIVFHNAASKKTVSLKDPMRDLEINAKGTFNMLEAARIHKVKKFIHASTGSVYGEPVKLPTDETHPLTPTSFYGVSKLAGDKYCKLFSHIYKMDTTVLRYHHVYGPKQEYSDIGGVVPIFIRRLFNNQAPIIHGDGAQLRSFTYVKDVVNANFLVAMKPESKGEAYNLASGLKITIKELAEKLTKIMGKNFQPVHDDWTIGDIKIFDIDNSKLAKLGMKYETSFDEGLQATVEWLVAKLKQEQALSK